MFTCDNYSQSFWNDVQDYAKRGYPEEVGGLIVDGQFVPMPNTAADKRNNYQLDTTEYLRHLDSGGLEGFVHTHPDGYACPSKGDMQQQQLMALPWVIVAVRDKGYCEVPFCFGDECETPDIIKRPFRFGVTDCFTLVRDWYKINKGVTLPNPPRSWREWDKESADSFGQNYKRYGFKVVPFEKIEVGDCFVADISKRAGTHTGIYTGKTGDTILHHPSWNRPFDQKRFATETPVGPYLPHILYWLRYSP